MTIVDVDDGAGNVEQVIVTNDEDFPGLSFVQEADNFVGRRYGKYRPLFNGLIVVTPQFGKLLVCLFSFLVVGAVLVFLFDSIWKNLGGGWVFWLGQVLVTLCIILLIFTSCTDPGIIPRDFNLSQYLFEIRDSPTPPPARPRWCRKCQATRPPRCYHCGECDICIRRQDMHLLIGGVCVGSRNFRQYLAFNVTASILSMYLISVGVLLIIKLLQKNSTETAFMRFDFNLSCFLLFCGAILISFPQTGFIMFVYRLYLVSKNRTVREEYRSFIRRRGSEVIINPFDKGFVLNIWEFLMKEPEPSCFRKKKNQVLDDSGCFGSSASRRRWRIVNFVNNNGFNNDNGILFFPSQNFLGHHHHHHYYDNRFGSDQNQNSSYLEYLESESIRQNLNTKAKIKSHKSALLHAALHQSISLEPPVRFRRTLHPKPLDLLQQQLKQYQLNQTLPKTLTSVRKLRFGQYSRSESSLPQARSSDGAATVVAAAANSSAIVNQARAWQIQQIIGCVLRRGRRGLVELSRRIGMDHFDPDDIQMIELNNGLPLLSSRTQNHNNNNINNGRRGQLQPVPPQRPTQAVLGIPQMIAAGLIPPLRSLQQQAAASLALARLHGYNNNNNNSCDVVLNHRHRQSGGNNQIQFDLARNRRQFMTSIHIRPSLTTGQQQQQQQQQVIVNSNNNNCSGVHNQYISRHRHRHVFNLINTNNNNNVRTAINNNSQDNSNVIIQSEIVASSPPIKIEVSNNSHDNNGNPSENSRSRDDDPSVILFVNENVEDENEER